MASRNSLHARDFVIALAARGQYLFSSADARKAMGVSADAAKVALNRLGKQGLVASPGRGFYVIVPPEYRSLGCLPAEQFIPELMKRQGLPYYVACYPPHNSTGRLITGRKNSKSWSPRPAVPSYAGKCG